MAKTFLEKVKDKTNEVNAIRPAVEKEIASAEYRMKQIDAEKAEALRVPDRNKYLELCKEAEHLREYVASNKEYLDGLSVKMPFEEVFHAWKEEQAEYEKTLDKQEVKLTKLLSDLVDIYRTIETGRELFNMNTGEYSSYVDSYPPGYSDSSFTVKIVSDIPKLGELHRFLLSQGLITRSGQRV